MTNAEPQYYSAPRVMNSANNFITVSMLKDVIRRGTARKALKLERKDLAGKTGTTNDYIDAWFSGFNSKVATTVWVGFDDPATLGRGEAGSRAALPIWIDYMRTGLDGVPQDPEQTPPYIEQTWIDRATGKRTNELDPDAISEYFVINDLIPELISPEAKAALFAQHAVKQALEKEELEKFNALSPEQQALQKQLELEQLELEYAALEAERGPDYQPNSEQIYGADLYGEDGSDPSGSDPQLPSLQERIIEQEQDTEGLF